MKTPTPISRFGRWLLTQATWRSVVRVAGLIGMGYLVVERDHPDPTAIIAMATMIGLASFVRLQPPNDGDGR